MAAHSAWRSFDENMEAQAGCAQNQPLGHCTITRLSEASLQHVFSYTPSDDRRRALPLVCKHWKEHLGGRSAAHSHTHINLGPQPVFCDICDAGIPSICDLGAPDLNRVLAWFTRRMNTVKELLISGSLPPGVRPPEGVVSLILATQSLSLASLELPAELLGPSIGALAGLRQLESLHITLAEVPGVWGPSLLEALQCMPRLQRLRLEGGKAAPGKCRPFMGDRVAREVEAWLRGTVGPAAVAPAAGVVKQEQLPAPEGLEAREEMQRQQQQQQQQQQMQQQLAQERALRNEAQRQAAEAEGAHAATREELRAQRAISVKLAAEKTRLTEEAAKQHAMCDRLTTAVQDAQAAAAQKQEALRIEQSKVAVLMKKQVEAEAASARQQRDAAEAAEQLRVQVSTAQQAAAVAQDRAMAAEAILAQFRALAAFGQGSGFAKQPNGSVVAGASHMPDDTGFRAERGEGGSGGAEMGGAACGSQRVALIGSTWPIKGEPSGGEPASGPPHVAATVHGAQSQPAAVTPPTGGATPALHLPATSNEVHLPQPDSGSPSPDSPHQLILLLCETDQEMTKLEAHVSSLGGALSLGWSVRLTWRAKGTRAGTYDTIFCSPNGCEYRSKVAVARALGLPKGGAQVEPASEAGQALRAEPPPLVDPDAAPITLTGRLSNWTGFNMIAGVWEAGGGVPIDSTYRLPPLRRIPAELWGRSHVQLSDEPRIITASLRVLTRWAARLSRTPLSEPFTSASMAIAVERLNNLFGATAEDGTVERGSLGFLHYSLHPRPFEPGDWTFFDLAAAAGCARLVRRNSGRVLVLELWVPKPGDGRRPRAAAAALAAVEALFRPPSTVMDLLYIAGTRSEHGQQMAVAFPKFTL